MFLSRFMPCAECGASVERSTAAHECDPERQADYLMFGLREHVAAFDTQLHRFLASAHGQFEAWLAARHVRGAASGPRGEAPGR
jgi:hypothetical protein